MQMTQLLVPCRYKIDDPEFKTLQDLTDAGNKAFGQVVLYDFLPLAKYLPITWLPAFKKVKDTMDGFEATRTRQIEEHRRTLVGGETRSGHPGPTHNWVWRVVQAYRFR